LCSRCCLFSKLSVSHTCWIQAMVACHQNENISINKIGRNAVSTGEDVHGIKKAATTRPLGNFSQANSIDSRIVTQLDFELREDSIHNPQVIAPKPRDLTVPKEFNLSCSNTPSQMACPSRQGFAPSRAELQKQYADTQSLRMAEQRKRNEKTCQQAIHNPQVIAPKPRDLTVPREFNLSCSNTPSRSRCTSPARSRCTTPSRSRSRCTTPARSECSDMQFSDAGSVRSRGRTLSNKKLTVAKGPDLMTACRPRSLSRPIPDFSLRGANASTQHGRRSRQASASPARSGFSRGGVFTTPGKHKSRDQSCDSISSDMALSMPGSSVRSRMGRSCDSRSSCYSRLSQRSLSRGLSTEEIDELRIAAKRNDVKAQMKYNEKRCREVLQGPDQYAARRPRALTVPKEFNLSCPATPARSVVMSDSESECGDSVWSSRQRSRQRSVPASPARAWEPQLTVPAGPLLRTASRSRASSRGHSSTQRDRSMSQHRLPRENVAIACHLDRAAKADMQRKTNTTEGEAEISACKEAGVDLSAWVKAAATPQERAQRARQVAEMKHNKKKDENDARVKVFTRAKVPGAQAGSSRLTKAALDNLGETLETVA